MLQSKLALRIQVLRYKSLKIVETMLNTAKVQHFVTIFVKNTKFYPNVCPQSGALSKRFVSKTGHLKTKPLVAQGLAKGEKHDTSIISFQ